MNNVEQNSNLRFQMNRWCLDVQIEILGIIENNSEVLVAVLFDRHKSGQMI